MADRAADELRQKVLSGELVPGQRLVQDDLASALGVSVTPVREALFRLANEGLIHAERNRSFTVASNTDDDLRDMFWIHGTIASELASRACLHATDELVAELTDLHKEYLRVLNDPEARFDVSWNFFRVFYRAA
jgi:DNA-binding GntR family transcriptional regulator